MPQFRDATAEEIWFSWSLKLAGLVSGEQARAAASTGGKNETAKPMPPARTARGQWRIRGADFRRWSGLIPLGGVRRCGARAGVTVRRPVARPANQGAERP